MEAAPARVVFVNAAQVLDIRHVRAELAWLQGAAADDLLTRTRAALSWLALPDGGRVVLPPDLPSEVRTLIQKLRGRQATQSPTDAHLVQRAADVLRTLILREELTHAT